MSKIVMDIGGSIVAPKDFDIEFLRKLKELLVELSQNNQLYIVVGGGFTCREYLGAAKGVSEVEPESLDWLGIETTRLNAKFLATIIGDSACQNIFVDPEHLPDTEKNIIIGGGWKPGWSTDYVATKVAETQKAETLVVMTNVEYVYDKDPNKFEDAKKIEKLSWSELRELLGEDWVPGLKVPFDPKACNLAEKIGLRVLFLYGHNLNNVKQAISGEPFEGSIIE
jgi:uridylate kinase